MIRKFTLSSIWLILFQISLFSQEWVTSGVIKSNEIEPKFSLIDDVGNSYILAAFKDTVYEPFMISKGNPDLLLLKLNASGNILWHKQIGGTGLDNAGSLNIKDNELLVVLNFQNTVKFGVNDSIVSKGSFDIGLCKFSSETGNYISSIVIGTSDGISDAQVVLNAKINDTTLVIAGNFSNKIFLGAYPNCDTLLANSFNTNFIAQINLEGDIIWSKRILSSTSNCKVNKIAVSDNGFYYGGFYRGMVFFDIDTLVSFTSGYNDNFLYKTDFNGNGIWVRRIFGTQTENIQAVSNDEFDNVYVLGNYGSPTLFIDSTATQIKSHPGNLGNFDTYICKYNRSGILQWLVLKGSPGRDIYNDFLLRNNLIFATGYFTNQIVFNNDTISTSGLGNSDAFFAAFNQIGDPISGVSVVGTGDFEDAGTVVNMDASSQAYVSGYYKSQEIQIGDETYTSNNIDKSDLYFAIYQHPLIAQITDEKMVTCHGLSDGWLQVTPYFGRPPYTYSWDHDPNLHDSRAVNLPVGVYTVTISDANDSVAKKTYPVTQPQPLSISSVITPVSCNSLGDGAIDITVTGGTKKTDYAYFWSTLDGSGVQPQNQDQTGLTEGTYTVLVKDDNLCDTSASLLVTEPAPIRFSGSVVTDFTFPPGNNGAVDLHVSGGNTPYIFAWTGPGSYTASTEDISSLTTGGLYSLALTDNKSCTADTAFAVNDGTTLIAEITAKTDVLCFGDDNGSVMVGVLNGIEPYTYTWSDGLVTPIPTRTGMSSGTYLVVVTDAALPTPHTSDPATVVINGPASALHLILDGKDLGCYNDSSGVVNLNVSGGTLPYRFLWNNGYTGEDQVNVPAGQYSITVTDTNNCIAQGDTTIGQPDYFGGDIEITRELLCHGERTGELTANANGGTLPYSYLWDDPGAQITQTAYQLRARNYSCLVTDQNQCSIRLTAALTEPDTLSILSTITDPACSGDDNGSIVPVVSGGTPTYDYVWSNNVFERINSSLPAGSYTLTVTDQNNCPFVQDYVLIDPDPVVINSVDSTAVTCYELADGMLSINASGGTGAFQYSADNGQSFIETSVIGSLAAGNYQVVVKDTNNCLSGVYPVSIDQPAEVVIDTVIVADVTCFGSTDGFLAISASGEFGIQQYSIDNGLSFFASANFDTLGAGTYTVVVKDAHDCISESYPATISQPAEIVIDTVTTVDPACYGYTDGSLSISATGGTGALQYSADNGQNYLSSPDFGSLSPGDYVILVKDEASCESAPFPVTLNPAELLEIDTVEVIQIDATHPGGSISLTSTGGLSPVSYVIVPDSSSSMSGEFSDLQADTYRLFAYDANLCRSNELLVVLEEPVTDLVIYDAFSPNGDGKNDVWHIGQIEYYPNCSVKIFNTWGTTVFTSKGYGIPWDGKHNGNDLPSGTYYYLIDPGDGSGTLTGPVSLVK